MKISIVMATFNSYPTLSTALKSVFDQTYPDIELLISDGGSSDGTVDILKNIVDPRLAWWTTERDSGVYNAWNKALKHATGDWILFLGSDDRLYHPSSLADSVNALREVTSDILMAQAPVEHIDLTGSVLHTTDPFELLPGKMGARRLCGSKVAWSHPGLFHHKNLFKQIGVFDESYQIAGDFELCLRYLKYKENKVAPLKVMPINQFLLGGLSSSLSNRRRASQERLRALYQQLGINIPVIEYWIYIKGILGFYISQLCGDSAGGKAINTYRILTGRPAIYHSKNP